MISICTETTDADKYIISYFAGIYTIGGFYKLALSDFGVIFEVKL